jgi:glycogen synthase
MSLNDKEIAQVLLLLKPNVVWTMNGEDYENIIWESDEPKPTLKQLEDQHVILIAKQEQDRLKKSADKAALLEKLGISEDEAKLLLG